MGRISSSIWAQVASSASQGGASMGSNEVRAANPGQPVRTPDPFTGSAVGSSLLLLPLLLLLPHRRYGVAPAVRRAMIARTVVEVDVRRARVAGGGDRRPPGERECHRSQRRRGWRGRGRACWRRPSSSSPLVAGDRLQGVGASATVGASRCACTRRAPPVADPTSTRYGPSRRRGGGCAPRTGSARPQGASTPTSVGTGSRQEATSAWCRQRGAC